LIELSTRIFAEWARILDKNAFGLAAYWKKDDIYINAGGPSVRMDALREMSTYYRHRIAGAETLRIEFTYIHYGEVNCCK
jgi:hypothetical protein